MHGYFRIRSAGVNRGRFYRIRLTNRPDVREGGSVQGRTDHWHNRQPLTMEHVQFNALEGLITPSAVVRLFGDLTCSFRPISCSGRRKKKEELHAVGRTASKHSVWTDCPAVHKLTVSAPTLVLGFCDRSTRLAASCPS